MSLSKTEKPTQKKISDAVKKGQSFKSKDLVITCLILAGVNYIITLDFIKQMAGVWGMIIEDGFKQNIADYASSVFILALKIIIPFLLLCVFCTTLPSLLQTGFVLATKIFKLNFGALNPINGTKKLFSLRTVKDTVNSLPASKIRYASTNAGYLGAPYSANGNYMFAWHDYYHVVRCDCRILFIYQRSQDGQAGG
jgi:flagellar biosynthesis protein FlhB